MVFNHMKCNALITSTNLSIKTYYAPFRPDFESTHFFPYPLSFTSHLNMYHILFNEVVVLKKIVNIPFCSPLVVGL